MVQNRDIFFGLLKFQIFLGCLKFLIFFWVEGRCWARAYVCRKTESTPPPPGGYATESLFFFKSSVYFTGVKWSSSKKSIIFQGSRGGPTFSRGVQLFSKGGGGSNCLFPIETHITCDFPGGGVRIPCPPSGSALVCS